MDIIKVLNLLTDEEMYFDAHVGPDYAVRYCHAVEDAGLATWFFNATPDEREKLHITRGRYSVCCGNWATMATNRTE